MNVFLCILFIVLSYLIGSIPFGLIVGKSKNVDLREHGSGNIGSTNAIRVLGFKAGIIAAILDVIKGAIVIIIIYILVKLNLFENPLQIDGEQLYILYGFPAVLGHSFSIYLKFKGGKCVATGLGVLFAINGYLGLIALITFAIVLALSRYVSLSSTIAAISAIISSFIYYLVCHLSIITPIIVTFICILIFVKHIPNYKRLINGNENRAF